MNTACPQGMLLQPAYLNSPVRHVSEGPGGVRQRLDLGRRGRLRFPVMDHLRAQGRTGYVAIGVHVGEVTFGNVGAPEQLGFTVIGGGANLASRLSGQCKVLDQLLLFSGAVQRAVPDGMVLLGQHSLRKIPEAMEIYTFQVVRPARRRATYKGSE